MICTEAFAAVARREAARRGSPDLAIVVVPHPVAHLPEPALSAVAHEAAAAIASLTPTDKEPTTT